MFKTISTPPTPCPLPARGRGRFKGVRILLAASASLAAVGCASTPLPDFGDATAAPAAFTEAGPASSAAVDDAWWRALNDPTLDALVAQALAENRDLAAAEAELDRARALAAVQGWTLLPFGGVSFEASRGRSAAALDGGTEPYPDTDLFSAGLEASWEADVFGRLRASTRAARADAEAVNAARRGVAAAVAAETAAAYVALRGAEARLAAARSNAETQQETLRLTEDLRNAGRASGLDVARAREQLAATQAAIPDIEADRAAAGYALDILIGGAPGAAATTVAAPAAIPAPPASVGLGSPEELLQRRPDIVNAARRLDAATARVAAARVDWWPRVTLLGGAGFTSFDLSDLGDEPGFSYSIGPRIDWPALDIRRNQLRTQAARAGAEAEFARYDQTVASGLAEVETALTALAAGRRASALAGEAAAAAQEAADLARLRYESGLDPFIQVLDAERRLAEAEDRSAQAATAAAIAYVRLGQALGAGWQAAEPELEVASSD
jgi:NodT family efflux transporter outer membrane factor (OMF) lipoprotein